VVTLRIPPHPKARFHVRAKALDRLQWIETALREDTRLTGEEYCDHWDVSQPTMSHDLNRFVGLVVAFGGSARRTQGWVVDVEWPKEGVVGTIDTIEWQRMRHSGSVVHVTGQNFLHEKQSVRDAVSRAILARTVIRAGYASTTSGFRNIRISPHTIVRAAGRHHVRAFDHDVNSYRDFDLARVDDVGALEREFFIGPDQDAEWNTIVDVRIQVRADLDADRRRAIALNLGIADPDREVFLTCRQCLVFHELLAIGIRRAEFETCFAFCVKNPSIPKLQL